MKERVRILRRLELLHELPQHIGNQNLLGKTQHEAPRPRRRASARVGAGPELRRHVRVADDGSGDELGEHGDIGREINGIFLRGRIPAPHVHDIAQNLEGIEADADGQGNLQRWDGQPRDGAEGVEEKVRVFEIGQQKKAQRNAEPEKDGRPRLAAVFFNQQTEQIPLRDGKEHQNQVFRFAPAVKGQTAKQQDGVFHPPRRRKIEQQRRGEKNVQKRNTRKEHYAMGASARTVVSE